MGINIHIRHKTFPLTIFLKAEQNWAAKDQYIEFCVNIGTISSNSSVKLRGYVDMQIMFELISNFRILHWQCLMIGIYIAIDAIISLVQGNRPGYKVKLQPLTALQVASITKAVKDSFLHQNIKSTQTLY